MSSAKHADQMAIAALKIEHTNLVLSLKNKDESFGKKVLRLAQVIDQRNELADPSLATEEGIIILFRHQISTELGRYLIRKGVRSGEWIRNYLPPEFKDESKIHLTNELDDRGSVPRELDQLIGLSSKDRELLEQAESIATSDIDPLYVTVLKLKNKLENVARDRNVLLTGHEQRDESRTKRPTPQITELWQAVKWMRDEPLLEFQEFVRKYPPPQELEPKWSAGFMEWGMLFKSIVNEKFSLTKSQWISRIKYMIQQSKHGAGVYDLVETQICDNCWDEKLQRDKEGCNSEMIWDFTSITRWRCPTCGGMKGRKRGLTREQVGDNKAPILTQAEELINNLPGVYECMDFYISDSQKRIYARKIRLAPDLSGKA